MTTFDKREEGFEKKFAHDEELRFKAMARRNKLLGLWARFWVKRGGCRGLCQEVVWPISESGDNDVCAKWSDLQPKASPAAGSRR
jgi:hypothetical protein